MSLIWEVIKGGCPWFLVKKKKGKKTNLLLAKPTRKSTQAKASFDLCFIWPPTCDGLHWLQCWCSYFYISCCKFFLNIWLPNASQHKLIASHLCIYTHEIYDFCNLCELASWLANPFSHPSQVHTQALVLQTCIDWRVHLARALQLNKEINNANKYFTKKVWWTKWNYVFSEFSIKFGIWISVTF